MTAFPTIYSTDSDGYAVEADDGAEFLRASSGKLRIQRLYGETRYNITFRLAGLTAAETLAVTQFYESYKYQPITWTDPYTSIVYDAILTTPPKMVKIDPPISWVEVKMEGTRQ